MHPSAPAKAEPNRNRNRLIQKSNIFVFHKMVCRF
jgi:hypothetical protein